MANQLNRLAQDLMKDDNKRQAFTNDPVAELEKAANEYRDDRLLYRIAVLTFSFAIAIVLIGALFLTMNDKTVPEAVVAIGSAAIGALGTLFVSPSEV